MARTVTPTGHQGIWLSGVAYLIASSATFQSLVGALTAAQALLHVATIADDTEGAGTTRPRAIVTPSEGFGLRCISLDRFAARFASDVSFEIVPSAAIEAETTSEDRYWDEMTAFCNTLDAIFNDVIGIQGAGTGYVSGQSQVRLHSIELLEMGTGELEVRAEGQQGETATYFLGATYRVTGVG